MSRPPAEPTPTRTDVHAAVRLQQAAFDQIGGAETALERGEVIRAEDLPPSHDTLIDPELVGREVQRLEAASLINHYQVGVHLRAMKAQLSHGEFQAWCARWFPWDVRTARNRMALAELVGERQKLLRAVGEVSMQKIRAIFELPAEDIQALEETGHVGGLSLVEIRELPYAKLKEQLASAQREKATAETNEAKASEKLREVETKLNAANARIADLTDPKKQEDPDEKEVLARLRSARDRVQLALGELNRALEVCGQRMQDQAEERESGGRRLLASPTLVAEAVGTSEYVLQLADHTRERFRQVAGTAEADAGYTEILKANAKLAGNSDTLRIPASHVLPLRGLDGKDR